MAQMCSLFACQDRKYVLFYLIGGKWFPDIAARSSRKRLHNMPLTTFCCNHYDRNSLRVVCYSRKVAFTNSRPSMTGILSRCRKESRSTIDCFGQQRELQLRSQLRRTWERLSPAWRSERSTIFRITEESSTMRARMLSMSCGKLLTRQATSSSCCHLTHHSSHRHGVARL